MKINLPYYNTSYSVVDNIFTYNEADKIFYCCFNSFYTLTRKSAAYDVNSVPQLECHVTEKEFTALPFMHNKKFLDTVAIHGTDLNITRARIICNNALEVCKLHVDGYENNDKTILYYANKNWDHEYGGDTIFANDAGETIATINYKPNRLVIFDAKIPHRSTAVSPAANQWRFTIVINLSK